MVRMTENLRRRRMEGEGGFTLIELLIVIVILGILAGVVVASVSGITNTGGVSACKADTKTLITAEETFYATPAPPGGGSTYANMNWPYVLPLPLATGPMVPQFIQSTSTLHAVQYVPAAGAVPAKYNIYVTSVQCGVPLPAPSTVAPTAAQLTASLVSSVIPTNY